MLNKKATALISALGAQNIDIAKYAGQSPSDVSRICTGVRSPARSSKTIRKFARGIYRFALENNATDVLFDTIGSEQELSEPMAVEAVLEWLYKGIDINSDTMPALIRRDRPRLKDTEKAAKAAAFGERMVSLIKLTEISAAEICRAADISPSAISNFVNGKAYPSMSSETVKRFSAKVEEILRGTDKLKALSELTAIPVKEINELALREWLCGTKKKASSSTIESFMGDIRNFTSDFDISLPRVSNFLSEDIVRSAETVYFGTHGLQRAALRFLGEAIEDKHHELLLFSNQDMGWMQGKYGVKWLSLMMSLLEKGIKVKIIHNTNRDPDELIYAVKCWMPLYFRGGIEPYYLTKESSSIISNTLFINDRSVISGSCVNGSENEGIYRYYDDPQNNEKERQLFNSLFKYTEKLLTFNNHISHMQGRFDIYNFDGVEICIGDKNIIINKLFEPFLSFTVNHPMLYNSFREYVKSASM